MGARRFNRLLRSSTPDGTAAQQRPLERAVQRGIPAAMARKAVTETLVSHSDHKLPGRGGFQWPPFRLSNTEFLLMKLKFLAAALLLAASSAHAQTEIQWWHSMGGALGEWVNDLAKDFNASQK